MIISTQHQKFLLIDQALVPAIFNFFLNALIAWASFRSLPEIPLWGKTSVAADLLVTAILLPFLTCLIVGPLVAAQVRSFKLLGLPAELAAQNGWHQHAAWVRGLLLATLGIVFAAVPLVWALSLAQAQPIPSTAFVWFKATWSAMLAFCITPMAGWWALVSASKKSVVK